MRSLLCKLIFLVIVVATVMTFQLTDTRPTQAQEGAAACWQSPRLTVGSSGRVMLYPYLPNRIRSNPSYAASIIGRIPPGGVFAVVGGPICSSGTWWWLVSYSGTVGWTAEGNGSNTYWLEPIVSPPPPATCALLPRLTIGGFGRVTPGLPNVVRDAPGTQATGANSRVIGEIPGGGVFSVLNGPQCGSDKRWWWLVNYNGLVGWTAEGQGTTYWLEPYNNQPGIILVNATFQAFEGGYMLWWGHSGTIWVLYNNGVAARFEASNYGWLPENPVLDIPPAGRYKPVQGFGKVWGNYYNVRTWLGWGINQIQGYTMGLETLPGTGYRINIPEGGLLIIRNNGTWSRN